MDETTGTQAPMGETGETAPQGPKPLPVDDGLMTRPTHAYVDPAVYNLPAGEARLKPADPKRISHRHQTIAYMAASGNMDHKQIAAATGYTAVRVYQILRCNRMKQLVASIQAQTHGMTVAQKFQSILPGAIKVAEDILHDPTVPRRIRADMAWKFIYQGAGKPTETVNVHQTSNISDLFSALDALSRGQRVHITPEMTMSAKDIPAKASAPQARSHKEEIADGEVVNEAERSGQATGSEIDSWVDKIVAAKSAEKTK